MAKNYIEVAVETREHTQDGHNYVDVDYLWAVRQSTPMSKGWKDGEAEPELKPYSFLGNTFTISGGMPVYVSSKEDIDGLRKLLDAIEEELGNE